jgi:hypothetical protein
MKRLFFIVLLIVIIANIPIIGYFFSEDYTYSNLDGSFKYNEENGKGKSYAGCFLKYGEFLCANPNKQQGDNNLYRTFTFKPWRFWEWREMIFHSDRFMLPYKKP